MKRLIAAIIILILSFSTTALGSRYINITLNKLLYDLQNNESSVYDTWQADSRKLSVLLKHEDIDNLDEEIENMKRFDENGRKDEKNECKVRAQSIINGILDGEKLTWGNVF